jgi:hypothetical protein
MKTNLQSMTVMLKKVSLCKIIVLTAVHIFYFSVAKSQAPEWLWAKSEGGNSYEGGYSIAVDNNGNSFVTGHFKSTYIAFDGYVVNNNGNYDIFLVKYNGNGNVLWVRSAGGTLDDKGESLTTDANGNVYITGYFQSPSISFGNYTLICSDSSDIFLAKYDSGGNVVWAKSAGGSDNDYGHSASTDENGNVYLAGFFRSPTATFGSYTMTNTHTGYYDIFLAKYNSNGNVTWAKNFGGNVSDRAYAIKTDASGNVFMTGSFFSSSVDFGNYTVNNSGSYDFFIAKFNPSGNTLWAKGANGADNDRGYGIATDATGNGYVTGYFWSPSITFGSYTLNKTDSSDVFIAKYGPNGNVLWAKSVGGPGIDQAYGIASTPNGSVYVTGYFTSTSISFGGNTLNNSGVGYADIFLFNFDSNGNPVWAISIEGSSSDYAESLALNAQNQLYITGRYYSPSISFGIYVLTKSGWDDIFVAKLDQSVVGIYELREDKLFTIYSNPALSRITIHCNINVAGNDFTAYIYNTNGQLLMQQQINQAEIEIDLGHLPSGVYITKVSNTQKSGTGYFVVY